MTSKKYSLLCIVLLILILSPSVIDCRGGRGGGGRSSSSSRSSSYSSSSRSGYSYSSTYSSTPTTFSYLSSGTPSRSSVTVVAYYRPAYYYYSYTYNGYVYVGAYYGYTNSTMNMTAIIVPCAIVGTIFLMIVLSIVVGKCTNRDCCTACLCIFCCQC